MVQVEGLLKTVEQKLSQLESNGGTLPADARVWYNEATHNIELVRYGGGVHNVEYSTSLLDVAKDKLKTVIGKIDDGGKENVSGKGN